MSPVGLHTNWLWGIFELENATGKNSAGEGFGQKCVNINALMNIRAIKKSTVRHHYFLWWPASRVLRGLVIPEPHCLMKVEPVLLYRPRFLQA